MARRDQTAYNIAMEPSQKAQSTYENQIRRSVQAIKASAFVRDSNKGAMVPTWDIRKPHQHGGRRDDHL